MYEQLRTDYDAAFDTLRAAVSRLRRITEKHPADRTAEQAAREQVEQALAVYRERRDQLADYLTGGRRHEVEALAYRLWEEAGRPIGNPHEHWYRAEAMLASRHQPRCTGLASAAHT